ncbi:MAG: PEP-CTERM sorting domain-containing protein [Methylophilaceae bacterium]
MKIKKIEFFIAGISRFLGSIALSLVISLGTANAANIFYYTSSPESYVGHGETFLVTDADGFGFKNFGYTTTDSVYVIGFSINDFLTNPNIFGTKWWDVAFSQVGTPLTVGFYDNVERDGSTTSPGLSFSGNGAGNSSLTGFFNILEITYKANGSINSFAADFTQYDDGNTEWWNVGSIRYNSDIAVTLVPEPTQSLLMILGLVLVTLVARKRTHI